MPNLFHTIRYGYRKYIQPKRARIKHVLLRVLIILAVALFLECIVFNFRTFQTIGNKPIDLDEKINLSQTSDGRYVVSSTQNTIELKDINEKIDNVYFKLNKNQDAQEIALKINFTDSGHSTYFDTTEYTVGIPEVMMTTISKRSQHFSLHATGKVKNLQIKVTGKEISYPIYLDSIIINTVYPFQFVMWRFLAAFGLIFLIYIFRPRSSIYKIKMVERPFYTKIVITATILIEAILVSFYLLMGSNLVGLATPNYNYGDWDGVSPINTFEVAGDNAQQYAELAKSMTRGKLYLEQEPPDYLKTMPDPYDKGSRDELQKTTGQKYLFDVAYRDGHYYVYFGVVPVVLFYLPFYLITGQNFPTAIGVLIMGILFIIGVSILLDRFARYHFKRVSLGIYLLFQIPLVICSGVLYLFKFPTFYSLPIVCSLAFAVWALYFWMRARAADKPCKWFIAGSLCMALIAGCRPQIMLIAAVAIPLFWRRYVTNKGLFTKKGVKEAICFLLPFVVVGIGLVAYNYARFGSFTDFGANYNLTMNDMTQRGMQLARVPAALFSFFIQPPNVTGVFPYLNPVLFDTTYFGQTIKEVTFGGVLACLPVLWVLFFMKPILNIRAKQRNTHTVAGVIGILCVCAVLIAILDANVAGILQRYYADFSFMLLLAAVLLAFIVNENIGKWPLKYRNILMVVVLVVVLISVVYSILTCFVIETGWYGDVYRWAYRDFLKSVMFWT